MADYKASNRIIEAVQRAITEARHYQLGKLMTGEIDSRQATTIDLIELAKQAGCSLRTIRYAITVYRLAQRASLSERDVTEIGWTKLAVVATEAKEDLTREEIFSLCEGRTVTELKATMAGIAGAIKIVAFALNRSQRGELDAALIRHGAVRVGRGLQGKEAALMKIIAKSA